nr:hypothetical protein [Tanacetum cinerariifolium]
MATTSKLDSTCKDKGKMSLRSLKSQLLLLHLNGQAWYPYDPIQGNMDVKDADYFDQLLQHRKTFINVQEIPSNEYPEHYFNFASYNELPARPDVKHTILT